MQILKYNECLDIEIEKYQECANICDKTAKSLSDYANNTCHDPKEQNRQIRMWAIYSGIADKLKELKTLITENK